MVKKYQYIGFSEEPRGRGMNERRVVITGLGAVTPFGIGIETFWSHIAEGKSES